MEHPSTVSRAVKERDRQATMVNALEKLTGARTAGASPEA